MKFFWANEYGDLVSAKDKESSKDICDQLNRSDSPNGGVHTWTLAACPIQNRLGTCHRLGTFQ